MDTLQEELLRVKSKITKKIWWWKELRKLKMKRYPSEWRQ
jgi:hypothetical protein